MAMNADKPGGGAKRVRRTAKRTEIAQPVEQTAYDEGSYTVTTSTRRPGSFLSMTVGVRNADITVFLRQLIMLIEAGTPLLRSLTTLSQRGEKAAVRALVADIAQYVEMGNPLWQAFERYPKYFDVVFVNLVKASEASGTLVPVLQRIVAYRERREILKKRVRAGMLYPVVLLIACFAVVMLIAKVIVPEFEDMFTKFNVELPAYTKGFMAVSKAVGSYWWLGVAVIVALVLVYKLWYVQNPLRRIAADRMKLRIPIVGKILLKNAIVEFTRTLALLLKSGLSMMSTLELVRNAIHNRAFAQTIQGMRDSVEQGGGLEQPMRAAGSIIPGVVADMMVTGEESGRLDSIAEQVANTYEEDVNVSIAALGDALQPILTIFLGAIVILVVLAVFIPLIAMIDQLGAGGGA